MRLIIKLYLFVFVLYIFSVSCDNNSPATSETVWDKTTYTIEANNFPPPMIKSDNILTVATVELGRALFYEKKLSKDNSISCSSCHNQKFAFSDKSKFSKGVGNKLGLRNSMSVTNMAWNRNKFFWDGRADLLRHQSLMPIQDKLEMDETLENVINKLSADNYYNKQFFKAFGKSKITDTLISLALEQFMFTIVSNNSKYDKFLAKEVALTESEERGRQLFFTEYNPDLPEKSGADCAHCHSSFNFSNDRYFNNGLFEESEITDVGFQNVTNNPNDRGKFKTVSLRNIALTALYMHDGQFENLKDVVKHYNSGLKKSNTFDPALEYTRNKGLMLSDEDINDLVNFLNTLTDEDLMTNPKYSDPFK